MTRKIALLPFVVFVGFVPSPVLSRIFDCRLSSRTFPTPCCTGNLRIVATASVEQK
jgi:hypothetical protein